MSYKIILRLPQVMKRLSLSRSTIYQLVKRGELRAPISLGARAVGWLESDIDEFIDARIRLSRPDNNES